PPPPLPLVVADVLAKTFISFNNNDPSLIAIADKIPPSTLSSLNFNCNAVISSLPFFSDVLPIISELTNSLNISILYLL
uniref:Uncharacterized protein n=1 Tax=Amphimedon queenslandica TaxID=400682 RepID=A0A1X7UNG6_AMPQE